MSFKEKTEKIVEAMLDGEDKGQICKDLKERVMKELTPEITSNVNKMMVLNMTKWKEDFVRPLIVETCKEELNKKK